MNTRTTLIRLGAAVALTLPSLAASQQFDAHDHAHGPMCGCPSHSQQVALYGAQISNRGGGSCGSASTVIDSSFDPQNLPEVEIPVVFHIYERNTVQGTQTDGFVPYQRIVDQMRVLNEDFAGLNPAGSGLQQVDTRIRFRLARIDPNGLPTTGVRRLKNNLWSSDQGNYWQTQAWNPNEYLNIYVLETLDADPDPTNYVPTQSLSGYVPFIPQLGNVGNSIDRIVMNYRAIGPGGIFSTFGDGHILTHEVGHFLGLYHTFQTQHPSGLCPSSQPSTYFTGDFIADTPAHYLTYQGQCPSNAPSCENPALQAPVNNHMGYTSDACRWQFSPEQANRMRCTLDTYRPDLANPYVDPAFGEEFCVSIPNSTGFPALLGGWGNPNPLANDVMLVAEHMQPTLFTINGSVGYPLVSAASQAPMILTVGQGLRCIDDPIGRMTNLVRQTNGAGQMFFPIDTTAIPNPVTGPQAIQPGDTYYFQVWYRDVITNSAGAQVVTSNFSNGYRLQF